MIPKKLQKEISEHFSKQEGRLYPCSNQIVVHGFIGTKNDWIKFKEDNKCIIVYDKYNNEITIKLKEDESFEIIRFININSTFRGYRFYEVICSDKISDEQLKQCLLPYCDLYCHKFEWFEGEEK